MVSDLRNGLGIGSADGFGWVELSPICRLIGTGHDMTGSGCGTKAGLGGG